MASELKVLSGKKEFTVSCETSDLSKGTINSNDFELDLIRSKEGTFHIIRNHKSYQVEVVQTDIAAKTMSIKVNNNIYELQLKDRYDELLDQMGLSGMNAAKINDLKAPMPGLVLSVEVEGGKQVKKGDTLLVLEAMKMENILKSPTDGIVKDISVKQGETVEKNQLLLNFE